MRRKLLHEAWGLAVDKLPKHPKFGTNSFIHFSFVVVDGSIIEYGFNTNAVPEKHWGYGGLSRRDENFIPGTHSELNAFRRARGLLKGSDFDMINVRLGQNDSLLISAPCQVCRSWLGPVGCRKIAFSVSGGWAEMIA